MPEVSKELGLLIEKAKSTYVPKEGAFSKVIPIFQSLEFSKNEVIKTQVEEVDPVNQGSNDKKEVLLHHQVTIGG